MKTHLPVYERLFDQGGFSPVQKIILKLVEEFSISRIGTRILEVGASSGYMTREWRQNKLSVDVVEIDDQVVAKLKMIASRVFIGSIEDRKIQQSIKERYDLIICADVLEHLVDPESCLEFLKGRLSRGGKLLISIPNVAFWDMRKQLLFKGSFKYQESGLLDRTHLRFYSLSDFQEMLIRHGLKIDKLIPGEARVPFEYTIKRLPIINFLFDRVKKKIIWFWPNLTFYHYVIQATE